MTTPSASPVTLDATTTADESAETFVFADGTFRKTSAVENMEILLARLGDKMSPAERRELQQAIEELRELKQRREAEAARSVQSATMPEPVEPEFFKDFDGYGMVGKLTSGGLMKTAIEYARKVHTYYGDLLAAERGKNAAMKIDFDAQQSDIDRLLESLTNESNARVAAESRLAKVMEDVPYLAEAVFGNWISDKGPNSDSDFEYGCEYCSIEFDGFGGWPSRKHDDDCIVEVARKYLDGNGRPLPNTVMSSELLREIGGEGK